MIFTCGERDTGALAQASASTSTPVGTFTFPSHLIIIGVMSVPQEFFNM